MKRSPSATLAAFTACVTLLTLSPSACARPAADTEQVSQEALPFTEIQHDLFAVPNSYANSWGDYDEDDDLDLAVSLATGKVRLYRNDRGVFVSVGPEMGMPQAGHQQLRGVGWGLGDYDNDGDLDVFVANYGHNQLYRNHGDGTFTEVARTAGIDVEDNVDPAAYRGTALLIREER